MIASTTQLPQTEFCETKPQWQSATWEDYLAYSGDDSKLENVRLFYHQGNLLIINMGWEGIDRATICDLFTLIFGFWFAQRPEETFSSIGRCLLEKAPNKAAAPDLVLYLGDDYPRWQPGETRRVDLNRWRVPNLIGEISDTTLATDLDEKKQLYADLGIPEYWVVDVRGRRVFAFQLQPNGKYKESTISSVLEALPISLLEQTLARLNEETNGSAAMWFARQITNLKAE